MVDPSSTTIKLPKLCYGRNNAKPERYCAVCKKKIPGMDHHCVCTHFNLLADVFTCFLGLGTCIGENNYLAFLVLIYSGLLQSVLLFIISLLSSLNVNSFRDRLVHAFLSRSAFSGFSNDPPGIVSVTPAEVFLLCFNALNMLCSFILVVRYALLVIFHQTLMCKGVGTYDYLVQRRETRQQTDQVDPVTEIVRQRSRTSDESVQQC